MQLEDFVSGTLVQIARAIEKANEELKNTKAKVNPPNTFPMSSDHSSSVYGHVMLDQDDNLNPPVHLIRFDVAVSASEGTESKGGMGIMVASIGLGTQGKSDASKNTTSRIEFGIPMLLPESAKIQPPR